MSIHNGGAAIDVRGKADAINSRRAIRLDWMVWGGGLTSCPFSCDQTGTMASGSGTTRVTNDPQGDIVGYCILLSHARFAILHRGSIPKPQENGFIFAHPSTFYRTRCPSDPHMLFAEILHHGRLSTAPWLFIDSGPFFLRCCCERISKHDRHAGRRKMVLRTAISVQLGRLSLAIGAWEAVMQGAATACRREIATSCGNTPQPGQGAFA